MKKLLLLILFQSFILADTFYVPSDEYPTIQSGLNAAVDGDTVLVGQGTYFENVKVFSFFWKVYQILRVFEFLWGTSFKIYGACYYFLGGGGTFQSPRELFDFSKKIKK